MAVTQATTLADFTSGIGTAGAVFQVDNANNRIGIGTTNPQSLLDVDGNVDIAGIATVTTLYATKGTYSAVTDTETDAAIVIEEEGVIYTKDGAYLRTLIEKKSDKINIGQQNTSLINGIELKPGNTGQIKLHHGGTSDNVKFQTTGIGVSVSNGAASTATIAAPANLVIDPAVVGDNTGLVRIKGDLFVDGTTTQINSTTLEISDFIVGIASTATTDLLTDGAGIKIGSDNTFLYEHNGGTNSSLKSSENLNVATGKVYQIGETERLSADTLSVGTGATVHSPASNVLTVGTNDEERLRVDSNGNVLVGTTDDTIYNNGDSDSEGIVLRGGEVIDIARKGDLQLTLNRQTNDGFHVGFFRSGSPKSYIATRNDAFCIDVNNSERVRIASDGKIGIGTGGNDSPTAPLSIKVGSGGEYVQDFRGSSTKQFGFFYDQGNWNESTFRIDEFDNNGTATSRLTITDGGNIGIGTGVAGAPLHVLSTGYPTAIIQRNHAVNYPRFRLINTANDGADLDGLGDGTGGFRIACVAAGVSTERFRIASNGYVGMNLDANVSGNATVTPWTNLHVVGSNVADGVAARTNSTPTGQLHVSSSGYGINKGGTISLGSEADNVNPNAAYASISGRRASATSYHYEGYLTLNVSDGTTLDEKVRIKSDGKVGIGTDNPGAKLHATGYVVFGPDGTSNQYQGLSLRNGRDSSANVSTSFIDFRNNLNTVDAHLFVDHQTDGGSTMIFGTTPAGGRTSDRRAERLRITDAGSVKIGSSNVVEINPSNEYPTIRPTLDLNFAATKVLDDRITFTRDGVGTYYDELGVIRYASNNVPRFDHDPTTGESLGLLIEESRTNLVSYSEYTGTTVQTSGTVNNWGLLFTSSGSASLTPGIDAPDGSNNAVRFTNNNTGFSILRLNIDAFTPNGSDTYIISFWARAVSGTGGMSCDLADGQPNGTWTDQLVTNKWVRVVKSGVPSNASKTFIDIISNINNNRVVDFWGVQLEAGAFITSYIPTSGSTVTRGADNAKITGTNFTDFHNTTEGTLYGEYKSTSVTAPYIVMLSDGTDNNRTIMVANYDSYQAVVKYNNGTNQAVIDGGTPIANANNKTALAFKKDDFALSLNGGTVATDTSGDVSVNNTMTIGSRHGNDSFANTTIKAIKYYNKRLPNAQLQGLTQQ